MRNLRAHLKTIAILLTGGGVICLLVLCGSYWPLTTIMVCGGTVLVFLLALLYYHIFEELL